MKAKYNQLYTIFLQLCELYEAKTACASSYAICEEIDIANQCSQAILYLRTARQP